MCVETLFPGVGSNPLLQLFIVIIVSERIEGRLNRVDVVGGGAVDFRGTARITRRALGLLLLSLFPVTGLWSAGSARLGGRGSTT